MVDALDRWPALALIIMGSTGGRIGEIALKYHRQATRTNKERAVLQAGIGQRVEAETKVLDLEQARRRKEGA